jgi:hypothetical protein
MGTGSMASSIHTRPASKLLLAHPRLGGSTGRSLERIAARLRG